MLTSCYLQASSASILQRIKPDLGKVRAIRASDPVMTMMSYERMVYGSSFLRGSNIVIQKKVVRQVPCKRGSCPSKPCIAKCQIAGTALTLGTAAVLPFYTLMILRPNDKLTRKIMESSIPQIILVTLYAYCSYLAWTPDTLQLLSAGEFMLPEINGITELFSNRMFIASAWLHMIVVDFFAARQIFLDGLKNQIQTRHSVALCLFSCPIGIITHMITKLITNNRK